MASAHGQGYDPFEIRPATSVEEAKAVWWPLVQALGWNRSPEDAKTYFLTAGKDGFLLLYPKESSDGVGCILPCVFDNDTGWVGNYCMDEQYRGRGWGAALFTANMEHFKEMGITTVGLDAVPQQKKTYERRGFVETSQVRGVSRKSVKDQPLEGDDSLKELEENKAELVDLKDVPKDLLIDSELAHTGLLRKALWTNEALFSRPNVYGYAILSINPTSSASDLLAWILVRPCDQGHRLGPVYADSEELAEFVLRKAMRKADGQGRIDAEVFMSNEAAVPLFERLGFETGVNFHRMWLDGRAPGQQAEGGKGRTGMWAIFDAGAG